MSFLSDQASYGQPAQYTPRNQELEAENLALKDLLPKQTHLFSDKIGKLSGDYLSIDKPFYDKFKKDLSLKTNEFKQRLDKGENITSLANEMSDYRNQIMAGLDLFKKRKDIYENWRTELEKNKDIDANTKIDMNNIALDNISKMTNEGIQNGNGLSVDLPLPSVAKPVNLAERAAKLVDTMVEVEGKDWFERNKSTIPGIRGDETWEQLKVDPTKFENFKHEYTQRNPDKIKEAVNFGLNNDQEAMSSLDQDIERHLYKTYKNANEAQRMYLSENMPNLHNTYKANEIDKIANLLASTKRGLKQNTERTIIDNTESKRKAELDAEKPDYIPQEMQSTFAEKEVSIPNWITDFYNPKTGKISDPIKSTINPVAGSPVLMGTTGETKPGISSKEAEKRKIQFQANLNSLRKEHPFIDKINGRKTSDEEFLKYYTTALQNQSQESELGYKVEGGMQNYETKDLFGEKGKTSRLADRTFRLASEVGSDKEFTYNDLANKLEIDKEDLPKVIETGTVLESNPLAMSVPGASKIAFTKPNGEIVQLFVTPSNTKQRYFTRSWEAAKFEREGKSGINIFRDPIEGNDIIAETQITPNGLFNTRVALFDKEKNRIAGPYVDLKSLVENDDVRWNNSPHQLKARQSDPLKKKTIDYNTEDNEL